AMPGLHVQLFRRLQAKWQCYDAYCRVCMALGVNQILQALSYYSIVHTLVENRSPSAGYALLFIFQSMAFALSVLDIAGLPRRQIMGVQAVGTLPAFLAALAVHSAERTESGGLEPGEMYWTSPAMFLLQAVWLELLLWVARPSNDDACLPRRFRTVLFLDVFGDGADPTEAEYVPPREGAGSSDWVADLGEQLLAAERVAGAENAMAFAHAALRRWEAAPAAALNGAQHLELQRLRVEMQIWRRALGGEMAWRAATDGLPHDGTLWGNEETRPFGELSTAEKEEDPFKEFLIGPFEHDTGYETKLYHYDIEKVQYHWEAPGPRPTLSLPQVTAAVRGVEACVRLLLAMAESRPSMAESRPSSSTDNHEPNVANDDVGHTGPGTLIRGAGNSLKLGLLRLPGVRNLRSRLTGADDEEARGIELSQPLVQRQLSPEDGLLGGRGAHCHLAGPHAKHFAPERLPWQEERSRVNLSWQYWDWMLAKENKFHPETEEVRRSRDAASAAGSANIARYFVMNRENKNDGGRSRDAASAAGSANIARYFVMNRENKNDGGFAAACPWSVALRRAAGA
ncbi:unnamed protein product, partial [Polarella glacialis]